MAVASLRDLQKLTYPRQRKGRGALAGLWGGHGSRNVEGGTLKRAARRSMCSERGTFLALGTLGSHLWRHVCVVRQATCRALGCRISATSAITRIESTPPTRGAMDPHSDLARVCSGALGGC